MSDRSLRIAQIIYGVVVAAFFVTMGLVSIGYISVQRPILVHEALLSGVLTATTAYLLYSQSRIMSKQADTEDRLLRYETEPAIEVVDKTFRDDDILLDIVNYGNGVARNLELICTVTCVEVDWFRGVPSGTDIYKYDEENERTLEARSVIPHQSEEKYIAEAVTAGRLSGDESPETTESGFRTQVSELTGDNGDIIVALKIRYESIVDGREAGSDVYETEVCEEFRTPLSDLPDSSTLENAYEYQR